MHPRDIAIIMGVCLVWAMNSIVSKVVVSQIGVPPLCYGMLRCVLIALAVFPWLFPMPQPRLRLVAASFLIGGGSFAIYYVASALFESGQVSTTLAGGLKLLGCVAFSALVVSVIAHTAYYWLINRYEANMIAPLILMSPVFTVVLGVLLLGDRLDLRMIVGAAITLIGVLIIALRPNRVMPRALLIRERM